MVLEEIGTGDIMEYVEKGFVVGGRRRDLQGGGRKIEKIEGHSALKRLYPPRPYGKCGVTTRAFFSAYNHHVITAHDFLPTTRSRLAASICCQCCLHRRGQ